MQESQANGETKPYIVEMPDEPQGSDEPDGAVNDALQDENQNRQKIDFSLTDPEAKDSSEITDEVDGGPIDRCQDENVNQLQGNSCDEPDGATISASQDENKTQLKCKCLSKKIQR